MPIYEYQCRDCGFEFEKIQRFSDRAIRTCPKCHGKVHKLISRSAFVLKGGGWYADGYSGGKSKGKASSSSSSSPSSSSSSSKSTSSSSDSTSSGSTKT